MKSIFFAIMALGFFLTSSAQTPIGKWKLTGNLLEKEKGTKVDLYKMLIKQKPCYSEVVYEYKDNGNLETHVPKGCMVYKPLNPDHWVLKKNRLIVNSGNKGPIDRAEYEISFQGRTMILIRHYTPTEKQTYNSEVNELILTYTKAD